jgi:single-strand DNA-binding protein
VFETHIVVIGNVLTAPEWRRIGSTRALVANFRVASTSRRLDRDTGRWVDGNHLRVRVTCWRKLAEGVASSITVGDPVVVAGRLFTRDWTDNDGNSRTTYEMEAVAVGHDLARGRGKFFRNRATLATSAVESDDSVRGEAAEPVPEHEVPAAYGDGIPDEHEPTFLELPGREDIGVAFPDDELDEFPDAPEQPVGSSTAEDGEIEIAVEAIVDEAAGGDAAGARPSRRGARRQPVLA